MKTARWLLKFSFPLSLLICSSAAGPLDFFQFHDISPPANGLYSITFANDRFVAVGGRIVPTHQSAIIVSMDGERWNAQGPTVNSILYGVTHGPGLFVAVGENGTILNSADGQQWTNVSLGRAMTLRAVTFGAGRYVAVGDNGAVAISTNGVAWTSRSISAGQLSGIAYGNGMFVAIDGNFVWTSPDGFIWTKQLRGLPVTAIGVVFGNGKFLASGFSSGAAISDDGKEWKLVPATGYSKFSAVTITETEFVGLGGTSVLLSRDGELWTETLVGRISPYSSIAAVAYGNGRFVASVSPLAVSPLVGFFPSGILISPDAIQWSSVGFWNWGLSSNPPKLHQVIFSSGEFLAVGDVAAPLSSGEGTKLAVLRSDNGIIWTPLSSGIFRNPLTGLAAGRERVIALGGVVPSIAETSVAVIQSNMVRNATLELQLLKIAFGKDQFVAVGENGTIALSPDGFVWSQAQSPVMNRLKAVTFGADQFVAAGDAGVVVRSTDGLSWTKEETGTSNSLEGGTYGKGLFVAAGSAGTVLVSPDARQWTQQNSRVTTALRSVCFGNDLFVAVGDGGTVLFSSNGSNWTQKAYPAAGNFLSVASGNGKFIAVGASIYQADLTPGVLAQPSFTSAGISLQVSGEIGRVYRVEASATMQPGDWTEIGTVTNTSLTMPFVDIPKSRTRFYRTVAQP